MHGSRPHLTVSNACISPSDGFFVSPCMSRLAIMHWLIVFVQSLVFRSHAWPSVAHHVLLCMRIAHRSHRTYSNQTSGVATATGSANASATLLGDVGQLFFNASNNTFMFVPSTAVSVLRALVVGGGGGGASKGCAGNGCFNGAGGGGGGGVAQITFLNSVSALSVSVRICA